MLIHEICMTMNYDTFLKTTILYTYDIKIKIFLFCEIVVKFS